MFGEDASEMRVLPYWGRNLGNISQDHLRLSLINRDFTSNDYEALLSLDEAAGRSRGANQDRIDRLPCYTVAEGSKAPPCTVCLDPLNVSDQARILPCLHQFHKDCIDRWLRDNSTCPVCKMDPFSV
ncbi:hypothetical protein GUITHDRAFT_142140 [Guillardia theta CCMP2712]|uniref:RING-type domain-containing protein n=1 Tax=Guillardia theta (strain CCMP2712) TaxID=905079 RepID=L1IY96_GUITC|nr:hypothetical protein GUITHDRAFT_142140 [Guillardia theta CCMP2712]EKX41216.1 hypothetical protein GUITHDRAFT_142140 [Guillardia theta CCMP2712]|eukprot:XP_005828196.1 hypothetical protein GUITHDRAFT_142140 [Guillardia theta CCMP2712]